MSRSRARAKRRQSITGETCRQIAESRRNEEAARQADVARANAAKLTADPRPDKVDATTYLAQYAERITRTNSAIEKLKAYDLTSHSEAMTAVADTVRPKSKLLELVESLTSQEHRPRSGLEAVAVGLQADAALMATGVLSNLVKKHADQLKAIDASRRYSPEAIDASNRHPDAVFAYDAAGAYDASSAYDVPSSTAVPSQARAVTWEDLSVLVKGVAAWASSPEIKSFREAALGFVEHVNRRFEESGLPAALKAFAESPLGVALIDAHKRSEAAREGAPPGTATLQKQLDHEPTETCFENIPDTLSIHILRPGGIERTRRAEQSVKDYAREHGIPTTWDEVLAEAERGERVVTPLRAAVSDADARILAVLQSLRARGRVEPGPSAKRLLTEEQHAEYGRALGEIAHRILADEVRFQANARDSAAVTE